MPAKLDRCVKKVIAKGHSRSSAFAICNKSLGLTKYSHYYQEKDKAPKEYTWVEVKGFPEYEIHPLIGIKRKNREKPLKGRTWLGYPKITLMKDGKKHERRIHRLIAEHFLPNPDNKPVVNHKDSNRMNFSIDNLEWVDFSENQYHRWLTHKQGVNKMKYTPEYGKHKKNDKISKKVKENIQMNANRRGMLYKETLGKAAMSFGFMGKGVAKNTGRRMGTISTGGRYSQRAISKPQKTNEFAHLHDTKKPGLMSGLAGKAIGTAGLGMGIYTLTR